MIDQIASVRGQAVNPVVSNPNDVYASGQRVISF
jgi:hypothetical protein